MTVRRLAGGLAGLVCGAALAQPPLPPVTPAGHTQKADIAPGKSSDGQAAFPKALADARAALTAARDYTATLVRQERVNGVQLPEQTCALVSRTGSPAAVAVTVTAPKQHAGTSTSYLPSRGTITVRQWTTLKPTPKTLPADDPAARPGCKHPVTGYGLAAVLDRVDAVLADQQRSHRPVQVLRSDYTFADKPVVRFEVFADRPTADLPRRLVVCFDPATRLPVRYEAYGAVTPASPDGELMEVVSFVGVKLNAGVGDAAFGK